MIAAVIPARGGSKRIPGKNIRPFCGKPIIQYSIDAAKASGIFDRIVVSTDSDEVASVARACGAEVPFLRPEELADDFTPTLPVIRHSLMQLQTASDPVDAICCIYATAPLVDPRDLQTGFMRLQGDRQADFAISVTTFPFPILRSLKREGNYMRFVFSEHSLTRSQDLSEAWHDAGQFYWGWRDAWSHATEFFTAASIGIPIPRDRVQDIDTPEDWARAEKLFRLRVQQQDV